MPDSHHTWIQTTVNFTDPSAAEYAGVHHLAPELDGLAWFLIRKGAWRCRIHLPQDVEERAATEASVTQRLDDLATTGTITSWTRAVYEPETRAFGGTPAMATAHALFCADTHHSLRFLAQTGSERDRRREISFLLCRTLMRAAGLDRYEQGDVWDRVATTRPLPATGPRLPEGIHRQIHSLLSVAPGPEAAHFATGGAFDGHAPWARTFQGCGRDLAELHTQGRLKRGLRAILAHHILFHWNRLGVPGPAQAVLAHTAAQLVFDPETVPL